MTTDATETTTYVVTLPAGMKLLNANDRTHWRTRARITKALREAAEKSALDVQIPPLDRATIEAVLHPHDKRRRDAHNWYPSFKAAIDGIVDAGVLPDDNGKHLLEVKVVLGTPVRHNQIALRITPVGGVS
jgi:crossover junction endodeoxyribonuclease RusA